MTPFDPTRYGPAFADLLSRGRVPDLGPGSPDADALTALRAMSAASFPKTVVDPAAAAACLAGAWLLYDHHDRSHAISQDLQTREGSFWHGILHRREPDYWNAKYWFRRTGSHPVFGPLGVAAVELGVFPTADYDPMAFVDRVESAARGRFEEAEACRRLQLVEWRLLFDHCYRLAVGEA